MAVLIVWIQLNLILRFVEAALTHAARRGRVSAALSGLGLDHRLGPLFVAAEIGIAIGLLAEPRIGALAALAFVGASTAWAAAQLKIRGVIADCGCRWDQHPVDRAFFAGNTALILGSSLVLLYDVARAPDAVLMAVLLVCLQLLLRSVLRQPGRSRSRMRSASI